MSELPKVPAPGQQLLETGRMAELGMLTASLIHELRQPLFALKAYAEMLRQRPDLAEEFAQHLLDQAHTMEQLLEGYGDFSRRPSENPEMLDVRAPLQSALVILERRAYAADVILDVELPSMPCVRGSGLALQQAIVNLGANAIDAVKGREGAKVRLFCRQEGERVCIAVVDNGPGFPSSMRENPFEAFRTTKPGGTGLGLVLTRQLIGNSGGEIFLKEAPGTWWEIWLPLAD